MIVIETSMQNDLKTTIERAHWTFELSNFVSLALTITLTRSVNHTDSFVLRYIVGAKEILLSSTLGFIVLSPG